EYLLALSEMGIFGLLCWLLLLYFALRTGMKTAYFSQSQRSRLIAMMVTCGLVTYFVHALFNNYLNVDKAAFLFWGALSLLATLDVREQNLRSTKGDAIVRLPG
nr:hypothetical protein [Bacteroidota bacterium]